MKLTNAILQSLAFGLSLGSATPSCNQVATVNLNTRVGKARNLASGFIYGFPDNGTEADDSIPSYLVRGINFHANRAGGAQLVPRGWVGGYEDYVARFNSTLSNYKTTRKYGGDFILLVHDIWGADGSLGDAGPYPGDDGNWGDMEVYLRQLCDDIKSHDMLDGLVMDLWNEPELDIFWARPWAQYVEYYVRASRIVR